MNFLKKIKRGSVYCLIFAVLILGIGTAYCSASDMGERFTEGQELEEDPVNSEIYLETEEFPLNSETKQEMEEPPIKLETEESAINFETEEETEALSVNFEREEETQNLPINSEVKEEPEEGLTGSETEKETEELLLNSETESETEPEFTKTTQEEKESETVTEKISETTTEVITEESIAAIEEYWQDCAVIRSGQKMRVANATIHRAENIILSYLDFPCYFKYATGHGQDTGGKTLAAYCVYNTREAPKNKEYQPDGQKAFSKEITYCLYNGCRYRGETAYNPEYSTGSWKKDYYITQIAIHLINAKQGRESSIQSLLKKSSNKKVYNLVQKMMDDAYADTTLTNSSTNQTQEVTYTVTPKSQTKWIRQMDGKWRTAEMFTCSSNEKSRVVSVKRTLSENAPAGTSIIAVDPNDPLSSFYFLATQEAYSQIVKNKIELTAQLTVTAEEYGGWWYEPVDSSLKRQYITFLSLDAGEAEKKPKVTVTADSLEQKASLTIYKEGEMLTGVVVSESGVQFQYANRRIAGAGFELRAGEDIKNYAGEVIWKKDALVAGNLITDGKGSVTIENLYMGNYYLIEKTAPAGMVLDSAPHKVTLNPENHMAELTLSSVVITDRRQKVQVEVYKEDDITRQPLEGAAYGVFAAEDIFSMEGTRLVNAGTLLGKAVSDKDGKVVFQSDLPVGYSYELKELQAPDGYVREENSYSFAVKDDPVKEVQSVTYHCTNTRCTGALIVRKKDKDTDTSVPQGNGSLAGAVYGLYAREDVIHPDGHTGVLFQKDQQVTVLETNELGEGCIDQLYLGNYYLKELSPPEGYTLDEQEYDISVDWENDQIPVVQKIAEIKEQVKKQAFQIVKGSDKGDGQPDALMGAGFTAWLLSDLQKNPEGVYETDGVTPVIIGEAGEQELFTDENGYLCTIPLPYGTYLVRETTVPKEHKPVEDFLVTISEHNPEQPQPWRILLDECFMAKLKIIKKDACSGKNILIPGAEFRVKNLETEEYVCQETVYPEETVHTSYFTNEEGYLILPKELPPGRYLIEEVTAPEGYLLSREPVELLISSDVAFQEDPLEEGVVFCAEFYNQPVVGRIQIEKRGNVLAGFDGVFQYEEQPLSGVVFELFAEEDIYTPDRQDSSCILYEKGTLIQTIVTDENGIGTIAGLPLGIYRIMEKQAAYGFVADQEGIVFSLSYEGQEIPVVNQEKVHYNMRQRLMISVEKRDQETAKGLAGALFGLYASKDILNNRGEVIVSKNTCLCQAYTDEAGSVSFDLNLPHGLYYVKEEQAPAGYIHDSTCYEVDLEEWDGESEEIKEILMIENQLTECEISKTDITSGEELPGATLELRNNTGELVERWISGEVPHKIKGLEPGKTYTLTEIQAPYGYVLAESVEFQMENTGEIQMIEMKDEHVLGKIRIRKEDHQTGEALKGAVYELRNEQGTVLEVLKTDQEGIAESGFYEIGKYGTGGFTKSCVYILEEIEAPEGYQIDSAKHEIIFSYENDRTKEVVWEKTLKNEKTEQVTVTAKAVQTGDTTDLFAVLCTLFLSGELIFVLLFIRKRMR